MARSMILLWWVLAWLHTARWQQILRSSTDLLQTLYPNSTNPAGLHPTGYTMAWVLYLLAKHPAIDTWGLRTLKL